MTDWADEDEWWLDEPLPPAPPPVEPEDLPSHTYRPSFRSVTLGSDVFFDPAGGGSADGLVDLARAVAHGSVSRVPGFVSVMELCAQADAGFDTFGAATRVVALMSVQQIRGWLDGTEQSLLACIANHDATPDGWEREEVAAALRLPPVTAGSRMRAAQTLVNDLPRTWEALWLGRIANQQALAITEASWELAAPLAGALEAAVLEKAMRQTIGQTRVACRKAVLRLDPATAAERHQRAVADRSVRLRAADHGMAELRADLSAADAKAIDALLDAAADEQLLHNRQVAAAAREIGDDGPEATTARTRAQIRADLLVDWLLGPRGSLAASGTPVPVAPLINVHLNASTLAGGDDEPAWLEGYGPITADAARVLAADPTGTWRRLITDPATRRLLAYDPLCYRPPAGIAAHIRRIAMCCTFPGCGRRAERCDLDHAVPFPQGCTDECNLHPVCRRHHRAKHEAGWHPEIRDHGVDWVSPQGRRYRTDYPYRLSEPPPEDRGDDAPIVEAVADWNRLAEVLSTEPPESSERCRRVADSDHPEGDPPPF